MKNKREINKLRCRTFERDFFLDEVAREESFWYILSFISWVQELSKDPNYLDERLETYSLEFGRPSCRAFM